jgi:hypothetical protein
MSNYADFFAQDFAKRCGDLLMLLPNAKRVDREVTLLLSIAAAGIVIPHERLSHDSADPDKGSQPRLRREDYSEAASALRLRLTEPMPDGEAWRPILLKSADGDPEQWGKLPDNPPSTTKRDVVITIRHALAHGNICTRSAPDPVKVERRIVKEILFVCGYPPKKDGTLSTQPLRYLAVTPEQLRWFLQMWFNLLKSLGAGPEDVAKALHPEAA